MPLHFARRRAERAASMNQKTESAPQVPSATTVATPQSATPQSAAEIASKAVAKSPTPLAGSFMGTAAPVSKSKPNGYRVVG